MEDLLKCEEKTALLDSLITKHKNSRFDLLGVDILYLFIFFFLILLLVLYDNIKARVTLFNLVSLAARGLAALFRVNEAKLHGEMLYEFAACLLQALQMYVVQ